MLKERIKFTSKKGITLIALVITIIIMLILVTVSVSIAINGGLFNTTKKAAKQTDLGQVNNFTDIIEKNVTAVAFLDSDIEPEQIEKIYDKILTLDNIECGDVINKYCENVDLSNTDEENMGNVKLKLKDEYGGYSDILLSDIYKQH